MAKRKPARDGGDEKEEEEEEMAKRRTKHNRKKKRKRKEKRKGGTEKGRKERISKQISSKKINIIISNITEKAAVSILRLPHQFPP